ncbi:hypothetical protein ACIPC1_13085 [Streptomyces sp. NPDC087263]|uniref:hypothetical protein n=1 Tax=Streptomyces sp. NPDC087263 TaxID=3365773 RepID=UPI00382F3EEC
MLKRSHLGVAGDCAIATIENRAFIQEIFEMGVVAKELGEPDLDPGGRFRVQHAHLR